MPKEWFYLPGDYLARRFAARTRRAAGAWLLVLFVFPGIPIWYVLRNQLWLIGLMSIIALVLAQWGVVSAETPVEEE